MLATAHLLCVPVPQRSEVCKNDRYKGRTIVNRCRAERGGNHHLFRRTCFDIESCKCKLLLLPLAWCPAEDDLDAVDLERCRLEPGWDRIARESDGQQQAQQYRSSQCAGFVTDESRRQLQKRRGPGYVNAQPHLTAFKRPRKLCILVGPVQDTDENGALRLCCSKDVRTQRQPAVG